MTGPESVAIIGLSGRFPKAKNLDEYWRNVRDGVECVSFFSEEDLASVGADLDGLSDPSFVNAAAVLEDIDLFDASFFGFSARDAEITDPQQRIFLECAWHSLEDAGYNPRSYRGLIGVFAGAAMSSYIYNLNANTEALVFVDDFQVAIGNDKDHLTTQASYKLNLRGPSMAVQTACSTSLVAVCMACQSLLTYQCDMALAGGVAADISMRLGYYYQPGGILSPDGHCRVFDAAAQGTVGGNGIGIVVLKRLSEAVADRDHIRAVIKGFALNNDGSRKVGYTAPSVDGQAQVIAMAQAMAGIEPETIGYIEAHGTGTPLGDPIEIAALNQVFSARTKKKGFCAIGSVKSNIGHLDTAAGVAGLIKTVLALEHKLLPPSLHFTQPNPKIDFANSPFYVNTELSKWKSDGHPRRAGVSSFGIGGTNAHVVVEEAPRVEPSQHPRSCCLLTLSAHTSSALETATDSFVDYLAQHPAVDLADVAYSYQVGREAFRHRRTLVCPSLDVDDARSALERRDPQRVFSAVCEPQERPLFFMFPGQGTQDVDMAREVYRTEPTFRSQVDRCSELLRPHLGLDLRDLLYPAPERRQEAARTLGRTAYTQPALFTIEYALARLWMEWGIRPSAMIGHSIGEYVAACLADVFSLEDATTLVAMRGQMMDRMPQGAMLAVPLSELAAQRYLSDSLSLAAVNGPASCVLSGPIDAVDQLAEQLSKRDVHYHRLSTSHAFHSSMMDPIEGPFIKAVRTIRLKAPQIPYLSNVTGTWITAEAAMDPSYWGRQLRRTVRFTDGLEQLYKTQECILLEVGPGQVLSNLARQHPGRGARQVVLSSLPSVRNQQSDVPSLLSTLGKLWLYGVDGNWNGFYTHERCQRIPLPAYPFERQRYWIGPPENHERLDDIDGVSGKHEIADWFYIPSWKRAILSERQAERQRSRWLVFEDPYGLGSQMIRRLEQDREDVIRVRLGDGFAKKGENDFEIDPGEVRHYHTLLKELRFLDRLPDRIVHFWSITQDDQLLFDQAQKLGFYSLLFLAQALGDQAPSQVVQIGVISNQIQSVTGEEELSPQKATLLGPCKVIPQEYPNITCRSIDLSLPKHFNEAPEKMIDSLMIELRAKPSEFILAYRGNHYWVQTFERMRLERSTEEALPLRKGGVYLITGGLGGLGLEMAKYLTQAAGAKLALMGRSAFLERDGWEEWLSSHDTTNSISRKICAVQAIEELGGQVLVLSANVADREQMQQALLKVHERFGRVHGVIHAAGVAGGGIIQLKTPEEVKRVMAPKVQGALVLEALFKEAPLDFFVLFSSLTSILGGAGQIDYCGANAFLDAFAHRRDSRDSRLLLTVNWDTWQEVGMAVNTDVPRHLEARRQEMLSMGILSSEGTDAFARVLHTSASQIAISPHDIRELLESNQAQQTPFAPDEQQEAEIFTAQQHARPNLTNPYVPARSAVELTLAEIWQQLLGVAPVGTFDNFFELGGHSLLAIQLISRLREAFQIEFSVHRIFEAPTITELAESIEKNRRAAEEEELKTAQLLDFVEQLSESEVRALLEQNDDSLQDQKLRDA